MRATRFRAGGRCISLEQDLPAGRFGLGATYRGQRGDLGPGVAALETAHANLRWATPISPESNVGISPRFRPVSRALLAPEVLGIPRVSRRPVDC